VPPSLVAGAILVGLVVLVAAVSFVWTPYDPVMVDASVRLSGVGASHWLGTDKFGRDLVSQVMVGARTTPVRGRHRGRHRQLGIGTPSACVRLA
jgi:peptide/nickel transport system permease protein